VAALATPDWRIASLREYGPELAGKLRMMPLPRFDLDRDAPTSTWGGTMIGIPRQVRDPEAAWQLLKFFYLSPQGLEARRHFTSILPAVPSDWDNPAYQEPDPYFGGQKVDALFVELARQVPARFVTPYTVLAQGELGAVLAQAIDFFDRHGNKGLEPTCAGWLSSAAGTLRQQAMFEVAP
jgi:arabinosaccharide transport system substrate-binding protein